MKVWQLPVTKFKYYDQCFLYKNVVGRFLVDLNVYLKNDEGSESCNTIWDLSAI